MANSAARSIQSIIETTIGNQSYKAGFVIRTRYLLAMDSFTVVASLALSILLRLESIPHSLQVFSTFWYSFLIFLIVKISANRFLGLYSRLWRYASTEEAIGIVKASTAASLPLILLNRIVLPRLDFPSLDSISILLLDWLLYLLFLSGSRLTLRVGINWLEKHQKRVLGRLAPKKRILIVGAGDVGTMVIRLMFDNPELGHVPVCFIDDDPTKQNLSIRGVPVLGKRDDIPRFVQEHRVNEVVVAIPTAHQTDIDDVCRICSKAGVVYRVIPDIRDLLSGTLSVEQLRQWRPSEITRPSQRSKRVPGFANLLVTGGAGFIGSNFVRYMLAAYPDYRLIVYDKLTYAGNLDNLLGLKQTYGERYVFVRGDICDEAQVNRVMEGYSIDAVVNFAAETHVDRSLMTPDFFLNTNVFGTNQLLKAARVYGVKRFHQISTDEVYGQALRGSFSEQDPLETRSPYSASKAAADSLVQSYCASFGVPALITRASNNIGPYQYPEKAVPLFITNALEDKPLPVYGDGLYVRDYQYVLDHCRGIDLVLHNGTPGEVYNIGGGNEMAAIDLAKYILRKLAKPESLIRFVEDRRGQDRRYSLNCAKIKSLGWSPQLELNQAIDLTIDWYVRNEWWWRKLKSGEYQDYYRSQYGDRLEASAQVL